MAAFSLLFTEQSVSQKAAKDLRMLLSHYKSPGLNKASKIRWTKPKFTLIMIHRHWG